MSPALFKAGGIHWTNNYRHTTIQHKTYLKRRWKGCWLMKSLYPQLQFQVHILICAPPQMGEIKGGGGGGDGENAGDEQQGWKRNTRVIVVELDQCNTACRLVLTTAGGFTHAIWAPMRCLILGCKPSAFPPWILQCALRIKYSGALSPSGSVLPAFATAPTLVWVWLTFPLRNCYCLWPMCHFQKGTQQCRLRKEPWFLPWFHLLR